MQLKRDPSILIQKFEEETSLISIYIDNFLLASNIIVLLEELKECFTKEYNTKNLGEIRTIIKWQISQDIALGTMKIN